METKQKIMTVSNTPIIKVRTRQDENEIARQTENEIARQTAIKEQKLVKKHNFMLVSSPTYNSNG